MSLLGPSPLSLSLLLVGGPWGDDKRVDTGDSESAGSPSHG